MLAKDYVCGMDVNIEDARAKGLVTEYKGQTYYFCNAGCKRTFDKDPEGYVSKPPSEA